MKIALSAVKNVSILTVTDAITDHDIEVLRAGLVKIFKTGKNKIILELPMNESLASEVIRELASFDIMARELAGRLVIAGVSQNLKSKIEVFAKPPIILIFESRDQALEFFAKPPESEVAGVILGPPDTQAAEAIEAAATLRREQDLLKNRLAALTQENARLKEQLVLATIVRRPPPDAASYLQRIEFLEAKIEKLLTESPVSAPPVPAAAKPS